MVAFIFYLVLPFFLLWIMGSRRAGALGIACAIVLFVLGLGFVTGLLITFFIEPASYWQAYHLPSLWAARYTDSLGYDDPLYKALLIPYVVLLDALRVYVHFNVTHGTLALWIPEVASWVVLRNFYVIHRQMRNLF